MMKLIASDLDGTLLLNGAQRVDESMFHTIQELTKKGYVFAAASGRHIVSLYRLFEPVCKDIAYISENGGLVKYKGITISKTTMDYDLVMDIIEDVYPIPNCELLVSGENSAYIKPKTETYLHRMTKIVNYKTTIVQDFRDVPEEIVKVSVCDLSGIKHSKDYLIRQWGDKCAATVSGEQYLDFMAKGVSKGTGIESLQKYFGISPKDCAAFGDNYNDISMLDKVYNSYVMEQADDAVKKHGKYICSHVEQMIKSKFL